MITITKPTHQNPVVDDDKKMERNWFTWMLGVAQMIQFTPVNTAGGSVNFGLGSAKANQGYLIVVKKTTGDANVVTPVTSVTGDVIDNATPLSTVSSMIFTPDGVHTWYRIL